MPKSFIDSLELAPMPREIAEVVFETADDEHVFSDLFHRKNKYILDDLLDFREYKIEKSNKTLDYFLIDCYNKGMRKAFESTFYQSFSIKEMKMIQNAIDEGRTSKTQLYQDFEKSPNKNILKNVAETVDSHKELWYN